MAGSASSGISIDGTVISVNPDGDTEGWIATILITLLLSGGLVEGLRAWVAAAPPSKAFNPN